MRTISSSSEDRKMKIENKNSDDFIINTEDSNPDQMDSNTDSKNSNADQKGSNRKENVINFEKGGGDNSFKRENCQEKKAEVSELRVSNLILRFEAFIL